MDPIPERMSRKSFDGPFDRRASDKLLIELVHLGKAVVSRNVYQPGWRWSESVGPGARTRLCPIRHLFYVVSGRLHVKMESGQEQEFVGGEVGLVPAYHDAWVVGDEPVTLIDFGGNREAFATEFKGSRP
jgi:hypothetical protein